MKTGKIVRISFLIGIAAFSLAACSNEATESTVDYEEVSEEAAENVDAGLSAAEGTDDEISVQEELTSQEVSADSEETSIEFDTSPYVEETIVYESSGITIIATGLTYTDEAVYLDMRIENNSDSEIWVNNMFADGWSTESSVNRCKTAQIGFDMNSVSAIPGGSTTFSLGFSMEELLWCGFTEIADIEAELYLSDSEEITDSIIFSVSTSAAETYDYDEDVFETNVSTGALADYIGYTILAIESDTLEIDSVDCDVLCLLVEESDGSISVIAKLHSDSDVTVWMPSCEVNDTEIYRQYASGLSDFLESGESIVYYYSGSLNASESETAVLTFQDLTLGETREVSLSTVQETEEEEDVYVIDLAVVGKYAFGIRPDGTVVGATEDDDPYFDEAEEWSDIVALAAGGDSNLAGLKSDGTVVAIGSNSYGQCDVEDWTDIVAIDAGERFIVGLKSDGTVVAAGESEYYDGVEDWTDIVGISCEYFAVFGLKSDGTVVATGSNGFAWDEVSTWTDIVSVASGSSWTAGLKSDGTVVGCGDDNGSTASEWTDIIQIVTAENDVVGLKSDGSIVKSGIGISVKDWSDIIQIWGGTEACVGLRADGTFEASGRGSAIREVWNWSWDG